jgi:hypothetical protein
MPQRKPYNPNTAYGRRKLREEAQRNYENMTPEQKAEVDTYKTGCMLIYIVVVIVAVIIYVAITGDTKGALRWLSK